jgi:hypothetical protein
MPELREENELHLQMIRTQIIAAAEIHSECSRKAPPSGRSGLNPSFERYIGIDYSGAQTPSSSLKGLRVYAADRTCTPEEVLRPPKR